MKLFLSVLLLAVSLSGLAHAQGTWGSYSSLSFTMTVSTEVGTLPERDEEGAVIPGSIVSENEYTKVTFVQTEFGEEPIRTVTTQEFGTKIVAMRIGNSNLIAALHAAGAISSKTGWVPQAIFDSEGVPQSCIVRHSSSKEVVELDGASLDVGGEEGAWVSTTRGSFVTTENTPLNPDIEPTTTYTASYTSTVKGASGSIGLPSALAGDSGPYSGLVTGSLKLVLKSYRDEFDELVNAPVYVLGATKLDRITAGVDGESGAAVVEGTVTLGAGVVVDLDAHLGAGL